FNAIDGFNINNFNNSTDIQFARMQSREKAAAGGNQTLIGIIATREEDYKNARGLANTGSSQTGGNQP
ncbi:MAG: hypothetical protein LBM09_03140, partial [Candidatus Nomurabacteria bacterium]|nr:hypothetical protein [Candidatus Nomurabacteria bacterium]